VQGWLPGNTLGNPGNQSGSQVDYHFLLIRTTKDKNGFFDHLIATVFLEDYYVYGLRPKLKNYAH